METDKCYIGFKKYSVQDCHDLESFLMKYYRHDRYKGRGDEYARDVYNSHKEHLEKYGYDFISRHESVTGLAVSFYP